MSPTRAPGGASFALLPDNDTHNTDSLDSMVEYLDGRREAAAISTSSQVGCCCGEKDCRYIITTNNLISELEENVQTAAKLGSALLARHEACMEDARRERERFTMQVTELEDRNHELERENSTAIEDNRKLLNTLEEMNRNVSQSDTRIRHLSSDLDETRAELDRVTARASRLEILEAQLSLFEGEQEELRRSLASSREEELAALARWQKAELLATELSDQCSRIEKEYAEEKMRSQRLTEKLEKQSQSEKSGRNPTSAARVAEQQISVSNFMKEILSDNAQLQAGTSELRRLLIVAQDEIGALREQVLLHQRIDPKELSASPLSHEFELFGSSTPRELHVHHHHHHVGKERSAPRKARKAGRSTPSSKLGSVSKRPTILGDRSMPPSPNPNLNRWSMQTSQSTVDSVASTFRDSSIFDSRSRAVDESRPTSAGSMDDVDVLQSPQMPWADARRSVRGLKSTRNAPPFSILNADDKPSVVSPVAESSAGNFIAGLGMVLGEKTDGNGSEEREEDSQFQYIPDENEEDALSDTTPLDFAAAADAAAAASPYLTTTIPGRRLRRSNSHESVLEPETTPITALPMGSGTSSRAPFTLSSMSSAASSKPILTPANARNTPARYSSSTYNRILLQAVNASKGGAPKRTTGNTFNFWFWGKTPAAKTTATSSLAKHVVDVADSQPNSSAGAASDSASLRSTASSTPVVSSPVDQDSLRESLGRLAPDS